MHRRTFVATLGAALATPALARGALAHGARTPAARRLKRVGIQLYTLRDAARGGLERTLADIAAAGYNEVELLSSMNNFGAPAAELRAMLDRLNLRAPSTHSNTLDNFDKQLDEAATLGQEYIILAGLPGEHPKTADDYRRWADRINEAARTARARNIWFGFHNHATDFVPVDGGAGYDVLIERTDPSITRHQLDIGNLAMASREPLAYLKRFGDRYWQFHVKDVPALGATNDTELGKGALDLRAILRAIDRIDEKHLYVEQETYPGAPIDSARRDYQYISALEF